MTLSLSDDCIRNSLLAFVSKISQLEERLKFLENESLFTAAKQENIQNFAQKLQTFEVSIGEVQKTPDFAQLKRDAEASKQLSVKCDALLNSAKEFMTKHYPNAMDEAAFEDAPTTTPASFLGADVFSSESLSKDPLNGFADSPIQNFTFSSAHFNDVVGQQQGEVSSTPRESSDTPSPAFLRSIEQRITPHDAQQRNCTESSPIVTPNGDASTPRIESIGLSSRSMAFFKSLWSPRTSTPTREEEAAEGPLSSAGSSSRLSLRNLFFGAGDTAAANSPHAHTPKSPLAAAVTLTPSDDDDEAEEAFHMSEDDSVYADAHNSVLSGAEADYEDFKFRVRFE